MKSISELQSIQTIADACRKYPELEEAAKRLPDFLTSPDPDIYLSDNYIILDFETTILDKGSPYEKANSVVCSSWRVGRSHRQFSSTTQYRRRSHLEESELVEAIEMADFWVAHNTKFEHGWLERCGLPLGSKLAFCTMLAEYTILSNRSRPDRLSLDRTLARHGLPQKVLLGKQLLQAGVCPSTWPEHVLKPYSLQDTDATEPLFLKQREILKKKGQLGTVLTRNILTPVLVDIEKTGMHIDGTRVPIVQRNYHSKLQELETKLDEYTGGANPRSPKQMQEVLYEKLKFKLPDPHKNEHLYTASGQPKTSAEAIAALKPSNKRQREFLKLKKEHSAVNAALVKCLNKFMKCVTETTNWILTASMNQAVTVTARLSSTGKNYGAQFQNFPRIFKPLFSPRNEGWYVCEIDQAQLEYRVAVYLGQDKAGMESIRNRVDRHSVTATEIFQEEFTELEPKSSEWDSLRTKAKPDTFKPLYGGESGTPDQRRYYSAFKKEHEGITAAQNSWKAEAINQGTVTIPSGLIFYFPGTRILDDGFVTNSTNICNYPVQSFATADIVPIGVVYQWYFMQALALASFMVNTVHDSSISEVHPDERDIMTRIGETAHVECVYFYLDRVYGVKMNVPLEVEVAFNKNWAEKPGWEEKYLTSS